MTEKKRRRVVTVLCLLLFVLVLAGATVLFWDSLTAIVADPAAFSLQMETYGLWGKLIFTALMAVQVVLAPIPGHPFEVVGGYAFGIAGGLFLTSLGALIGSAIAFVLARIFGAKAIKTFYSEEKLQKVFFLKTSERLNLFALLFFLIPGVPKDMLAYFMGITKMRLGTFLLISTVGRLPGILVAVLGGAAVSTGSPAVIVSFLTVLLLALTTSLLFYIKSKRKEKQANANLGDPKN